MSWLITGGAGYIGAHVTRDMLAAGHDVVVLDDLSTGRQERVPAGVPLVTASIRDRAAVRAALADHDVTAVMHFAARKAVGESVQRPLYYWRENVGGLQVLLEEIVAADIREVVFSSSAAVYGEPDLGGRIEPIREATPREPINPYGATKLAGEHLIAATAAAHGLTALSLRYFNVAGAGSPEIGDPAVLNLVPLVFQALAEGRNPSIFGDDYPTPDGTCIRDYIHVSDLSAAHVAAARLVTASANGQPVVHDAVPREAARRAAEAVHQAAAHMPGASRVVEASATMMESAAGLFREAMTSAAERAAGVGSSSGVAAQLGSLGSLVDRVARGSVTDPVVGHLAVNVGTGRGYSVREVMGALRTATGQDFPVTVTSRRPGDPPALVASADLARQVLGWRAKHTLADMAESAWQAWEYQRQD